MLYPLKFHPILKEKIWGGNKFKILLNKPFLEGNIGESWEISTVGEDISVVSNGELVGGNLVELIKEYKGNLIGKKTYEEFGNQFPLLIKFIDAKEELSVQLHPNDELAKERHNSFGKTEMWYVVQADKETKLIVGFNRKTSKEEYQKYLEEGKIEELLNFENIVAGDSYFINAGKIHAIGAGSLIAEIQQTSDITYRVYDWERKDSKGNQRELHTELALEALDFSFKKDYKIEYSQTTNRVNPHVNSTYFNTNFLNVNGKLKRNYSSIDSFVTLICVEGITEIMCKNQKYDLVMGETILLPACIQEVELICDASKIIEVFI
ncbi:type I phosphomannose isomerase catalytic subunit [Aquimarina sp. MMG016]|uniref:type I phosphomannose isomerase catalytic subunit n=1 Tax=Aquimarina sp. MMG016 TaxID=2822690 RepID=UPI001B3A41EB|nr:type I phosphomannose isomerase catalytic subunit [Aquimarina sp. MMG016]MBQ4820073.1 class I mannose-6-phosphate isomerase [Aquimarina sp. MMG016]